MGSRQNFQRWAQSVSGWGQKALKGRVNSFGWKMFTLSNLLSASSRCVPEATIPCWRLLCTGVMIMCWRDFEDTCVNWEVTVDLDQRTSHGA